MYGRYFERKFGVCGDPVEHSLSPKLFAAAYPQSDCSYGYFRASSPQEVIEIFHSQNLDGINITAPLKSNILPLVSTFERDCKNIGAANLLLKKGEQIIAFNFDHIGVSASLAEADVPLHGSLCLLLGAGGAAKASAYALLHAGATLLWANRTLKHIPSLFCGYSIHPLNLSQTKCPPLAQATSLPLSHAIDILPVCNIILNTLPRSVPDTSGFRFQSQQVVFDASYSARPLETQASEGSATYIGGERWLLHQAIPSFETMTGTPPNISAMEEILKNNLPLSK